MTHSYVLTFSCVDERGIVSAVSTALLQLGCTITDAQHFDDQLTGRFFSRIQFDTVRVDLEKSEVAAGLSPVLTSFDATWAIRGTEERMRVLIMASKLDHCLVDLLYRWRTGELAMDVVGIVSNHPREVYQNIDLGDLPFHHLPVTKDTKAEQESKLLGIVEEYHVDLVVLARYMQILSDDLSAKLAGKCINIHHSFLPGFKGAKPYHQAHARGVKLIGATAHYVTGDLDEGPIIVQDVEPVSHRDTPDQLVRKGRDIERRVLASAVHHHLTGRVLTNGSTTVVFAD
ncbi:formyltetrahydrofolate deformylase [Rhodococcus pseudokoreensis]|uniref:Formyltetrahydrofolate deformylase n=1 Tax=Rhodococcus pseudokoreensis TaxID=2811421 RepID=A0A974ZTP8_9NOCA|nr:formyltetrahydrofolate deformylase [Rhodococcus pseudokoreensis]QSE89427.1 formyltetrahydrofolate deformylase [Rhodococcus pseudokoreensis]